MEIVRSYFEQFNTLRFEGMAEKFWHPEIEYREDPIWPEASTFRGADEVLGAFKGYEEVMGAYQVTVEHILTAASSLESSFAQPGAERRVASRTNIVGATWSGSKVNGSSTFRPSTPLTRPSKPPGLKSRRCHRRTSTRIVHPGMRLGLLFPLYLVVGVLVAAGILGSESSYFSGLSNLEELVELVLAVLLWPLVLLDVNVNIGDINIGGGDSDAGGGK
ncbi:MAG: nuclear transport factor 2 family protein [Actinomycetota bacterium]|nr:nuclear transport factor 2 family protein [Actinomycetota bacterium]